MTRNTHDMELDHHGVALAEQIATGTATSGYVPVSAGPGTTPAWAAQSGGSSGVTVQDEGTPLSTTGTTLNFTGSGVTASGAGATKTINIPGGGGGLTYIVDGTLNSSPAAVMDGTDILAADGSTNTTYAGLILPPAHNAAEVYAQTGSTYADIWADSTTGNVEFYATNNVLLSPDDHVDCRPAGGMFFPPQHTSDPTGVDGGMYYNTSTKKFRGYNGTTWQDLN